MEKTIRDLCKEVARTGLLDTSEEAVVQYQDLIGHATNEENRTLSNDGALIESYYRIYGLAYGTVAAIKFYMQNSEKVLELKAEAEYQKEKAEELSTMLNTEREAARFWEDKTEEYKGQLAEAKRDMDGTLKNLQAYQVEVIGLKAKLYDLTNDVAELTQRLKERSE